MSSDDPAIGALRRVRAAVRAGVSPKPRKPKPRNNRDPQLLGEAVSEFLTVNGLDARQQAARVLDDWGQLVGDEVAAHVKVEAFVDAKLVLRADSTTWANQMRLLQGTLHRRLHEELGEGAVDAISVLGPEAPSWRFGMRRVPGRGPRDTYG